MSLRILHGHRIMLRCYTKSAYSTAVSHMLFAYPDPVMTSDGDVSYCLRNTVEKCDRLLNPTA